MHRARVDDRPFGHAHVHLGDERERLVGWRLQERLNPLAQLGQVRVRSQPGELVGERLLRLLVGNRDRREPVGALGRSVLESELAGLAEVHVDDHTLGRGEQHLVDELFVLVMAAVAADQLHLRAGHGHIEDTRVGRVREVEAHDLAPFSVEGKVRLAGDEHDVAETAHRHVCRLGLAEGGHASFLDQDVVEREQELAVHGRPVALLGRSDEDVPVQAQLLTVILSDVWVVPVGAGVGQVHLVGEALAHRDRCLRVVRSVVAVL